PIFGRGRKPRLSEVLDAVADAVGIPLALLLAGYTGVLLSSTATPVWSKNPWLGPLFSASAIGSGTAAVELALEVAGDETPAQAALHRIAATTRAVEAATLGGYLATAGEFAEP